MTGSDNSCLAMANSDTTGFFSLIQRAFPLCRCPTHMEPVSATLAEHAVASLQSGHITLHDFYQDEHDQRVYLGLIVPVLDSQHGNRPLGVIVLRIDPTIYLYPLIQSWPTPTASAETLLVRRDGNVMPSI